MVCVTSCTWRDTVCVLKKSRRYTLSYRGCPCKSVATVSLRIHRYPTFEKKKFKKGLILLFFPNQKGMTVDLRCADQEKCLAVHPLSQFSET